jgi:hypothetical protein
MTEFAQAGRLFRIRTLQADADDHHGHILAGASFEAAAVAYLEARPVVAGGDGEIRVLVHDLDSGHEHCFRIDLQTGETARCGE